LVGRRGALEVALNEILGARELGARQPLRRFRLRELRPHRVQFTRPPSLSQVGQAGFGG